MAKQDAPHKRKAQLAMAAFVIVAIAAGVLSAVGLAAYIAAYVL